MQLFNSNKYKKSVKIILAGSVMSQIITLLITPILTRLYSPEEFGVLALFVASVNVLSLVFSLGYEKAITQCEDKNMANEVVRITVSISLIFFVMCSLIFYLFNEAIGRMLGLNASDVNSLIYVIPLATLINVLFLTLQSYINFLQQYNYLSKTKVVKSIIMSGTQTILGTSFHNAYSLSVGYLLSTACLLGIYLTNTYESLEKKLLGFNKQVALKFINFPKYNTPAMFLNLFSNQLTIFIIGKVFSVEALGVYSLTNRIINAPITLIAGSVLEVYKREATIALQETGSCLSIFNYTFNKLFLIGLFIFGSSYFFLPMLFSLLFGHEWRVAGEYAQILYPMFFCKFVVSPLSYTLIIMGKQKLNLIGQSILFIFTALAAYLAASSGDIEYFLKLFSIGYIIVYLLYLLVCYSLAKNESNDYVS